MVFSLWKIGENVPPTSSRWRCTADFQSVLCTADFLVGVPKAASFFRLDLLEAGGTGLCPPTSGRCLCTTDFLVGVLQELTLVLNCTCWKRAVQGCVTDFRSECMCCSAFFRFHLLEVGVTGSHLLVAGLILRFLNSGSLYTLYQRIQSHEKLQHLLCPLVIIPLVLYEASRKDSPRFW